MDSTDRVSTPDWLDLVALGRVSAGLLALEVLLLRLFEFSHWHHFAGLAVSLALLGLGAAGTTLALVGRRHGARGDGWFLFGLLLNAAGFLFLLWLQSRVALRPVFAGWDAGELATILLVDFVAFLPFYGAGLVIAHVFLRWPGHPRRLYAANLLGSGVGSLGASGLLMLMVVEKTLAVVALILFLLGVVVAATRRRRSAGAVSVLGLVIALVAVVYPPVPRSWTTAAQYTRASLGGLPLALRPEGRVLALGSSDWQTPWLARGRPVTWVEPDGRLLELAWQRGATQTGLRLVEDGPWRFLAHSDQRFSVISLDAVWSGGNAATEDNLLTGTGLRQALSRLSDQGLLSIPLPLQYPPRHYTRIIATLDRALRTIGADAPGDHVMILRGMRALVILASPESLTTKEVDRAERFAERWRFDIAWHPGLSRDRANRIHELDRPLFHDTARAIFTDRPLPEEARRFHARPATLDRPYPWRSLEWNQIDDILEQQGARGWSYLDWTLVLTVITAVVATGLALVLILAPLGRLPLISPPLTRLSVFGCFLALGMGYMLIELALFQRLILYLGEPVLTASIVFAVFLVGSGVGSAMTPQSAGRASLARVYTMVLVGLGIALIPFTAVTTLSAPSLIPRTLLLAVTLAPLAWAMGRPLPWALARLEHEGRWIPWAWGINSFASVVGASVAGLVSVHLGQHVTLAVGAACYLTAFIVARHRLCSP